MRTLLTSRAFTLCRNLNNGCYTYFWKILLREYNTVATDFGKDIWKIHGKLKLILNVVPLVFTASLTV